MFQQKGSLKGSAGNPRPEKGKAKDKPKGKGNGHPTHYFGLGLYTMEVVDDGASFFANDLPDRDNHNVGCPWNALLEGFSDWASPPSFRAWGHC